MTDCIDLGYMRIKDGKWSPGICYCEDLTEKDKVDGNKCDKCELQLDPEQIVIPLKYVFVVYDYPIRNKYRHSHISTSEKGFTRREISEQIMKVYADIYKEEEEDEGKYDIYGHNIDDLILHSMAALNSDTYELGVDS